MIVTGTYQTPAEPSPADTLRALIGARYDRQQVEILTADLDAAEGLRMTVAERYLSQIEAQCKIARAALADEHEGKFATAVIYIEGDAHALLDLVTSW